MTTPHKALQDVIALLGDHGPFALETSQARDDGLHDCPCCGGEGVVDGETFYNFDGVASGVQFFGIGDGLEKKELAFNEIVNFIRQHGQHFAGLEKELRYTLACNQGLVRLNACTLERAETAESELARCRADAERYREIASRYQRQKTSESELFLMTLRLEGDPTELLDGIVDAAIATRPMHQQKGEET